MKKNLFKVLSLALVALMAMTCVAFAAENATPAIAGTYADGTATVNVTGVGTTDEVTILVVKKGVDLSDAEELKADGNIVYIDQVTAVNGAAEFTFASATDEIDVYSGFTSMGIESALYYAMYSGETEVIYGDIDGNGEITLNDVSTALAAFLESFVPTDAQVKAADVDGSKDITLNDVSLILKKFLDDTVKFPVEQ